MLAIEVLLLTGTYVATTYNDRGSCEWPPHPARLFSALVAAHHAEPDPDPAERTALEWLEQQGAPTITAANTGQWRRNGREIVTVFVPVNDTTIIGSFEEAQAEVLEARAQLDAAREELVQATAAGSPKKETGKLEKEMARAEKNLEKRDKKLKERLARAVTDTNKLTGADVDAAERVFPEGRVRQPRTFPSITPDDPTVVFTWSDSEPDARTRTALERLTERVVRLGHSSSLVRVRLIDDAPAPSLEPDELAPDRLRVPLRGQFKRLGTEFALHKETTPRVLPYLAQGYRTVKEDADRPIPESVFESDDWLFFEIGRPGRREALPLERTVDVAQAIRGALLEHAESPVPEIINGHATDGGPSQRPHLAIIPVPLVGNQYADGRLVGVAVVLPRDTPREGRKAVFKAVGRWEQAIRDQSLNQAEAETPPLPLGIRAPGRWTLKRLEEPSPLASLRANTWTRPREVWASATPVALDRNPGDLRSKDPRKAAAAFDEAAETIARSCANVGLPPPNRVLVTPSAPLTGGVKARRFPRFPANREKTQRVLVHATIEFPVAVRGPVLLGAGRYLGLGLFRPLNAVLEDGSAEVETRAAQ